MKHTGKATVTITITDIDLPGNIGIHLASFPDYIRGEKMTPAQILAIEIMDFANKICKNTYRNSFREGKNDTEKS